MSSIAVHADEQRSVRPYLLGVCFLWGLLAGFVFYLWSPSSNVVEDPENQQAGDVTKTAPVATTEAPLSPPVAPKQPGPFDGVEIEEGRVPVVAAGPIRGPDRLSIPETPPPTTRMFLNPRWGLTAQTAPLPPKPVKPKEQEEPSRPLERAPLQLNPEELEGPELDFNEF